MNEEQIEMIDSSQMQVFREFAAAGEVVDNTERFRVGLLGETVVINTYSHGGGWAGGIFFERAILPDVVQALRESLGGQLSAQGLPYLAVNHGKDIFSVREYETYDNKIGLQLVNNRPARFDGMEFNGWTMAMTFETAQRLLTALAELAQEAQQ